MPEKIPTLDFTIPTVDDKLLKDKISNHLNSLEDTEASFANQLRFESFF
ncbi:MAG: hypothetical protein LBQ24_07275 [Candidatus Peribacteria bacterium]|jgi:hypothetical protein|nr:hypothetical protein [Candidatus Peribacteria bacterium]